MCMRIFFKSVVISYVCKKLVKILICGLLHFQIRWLDSFYIDQDIVVSEFLFFVFSLPLFLPLLN